MNFPYVLDDTVIFSVLERIYVQTSCIVHARIYAAGYTSGVGIEHMVEVDLHPGGRTGMKRGRIKASQPLSHPLNAATATSSYSPRIHRSRYINCLS